MISIERADEENKEYEKAKNWLKENGTFKNFQIATRNNKSLNSKIIKRIHKITFQKNGSSEIKSDQGDDLKQIVINMYRSEF